MADLRDRGQIILIAAFALAVTFVALALVVNSAIFTENLASRGETSGSESALLLRHEVELSIGRTMGYANVYNTSELEGGAKNEIGTTTRIIERQHAINGALVNVSYVSKYDGHRVAQNESTQRSFLSTGGDTKWLVVDDVTRESDHTNGTRAFEINASTLPASGNKFTVIANTTAGNPAQETWQMRVWEDSNEVHVQVNSTATTADPTSPPECVEPREGSVQIDVTRGTVEGEPCGALRWADSDDDGEFENHRFRAGVPDAYNITFKNSSGIEGNYSLVTTGNPASTNLNSGVGAGSPYESAALYSVTVDYVYHGRKLLYETQIRVAPGENP